MILLPLLPLILQVLTPTPPPPPPPPPPLEDLNHRPILPTESSNTLLSQRSNQNNVHYHKMTSTDNELASKMEACKLEDLMPADMQKEMAKSKKQRAIEWGRPGHLTQGEVDIFVSLTRCEMHMNMILSGRNHSMK